MRSRNHSLVLKVSSFELAQVHACAHAGDEPISMMIRRWIAERYEARFGDKVPPDVTTKHGQEIRAKAAK